ncbi:MAG: SIS domain-containing protein [Anaerolineae bacterium]|nr:SIS domain-containing protein [Anaerolineae bacterium]MDW8299772.1 SIS domain-containing protein [Anaerolineae bacterium]
MTDISPADSILAHEIRQQPEVIARLLSQSQFAQVAAALRAAKPSYIVLAARGSSDNAARYAQYLFGIHLGIPVALAAPSISTLYQSPPRYRDAVVIGISQSGQAADVLQVLKDAAAQGVPTVAITNAPDSPMAQQADYHLDLCAEPERSIAATKTYTAQLTAFALLAAHLAEDGALFADLHQLPELLARALDIASVIAERAERFRFMTRCVVLGRGYNYATAFEIALKIKELTYVIAEPYSSADFRHGPKAMVEEDFPIIAIMPDGATFLDMLALAQDMRARSADLTVISANPEALALAHLPLPMPQGVPEWLSPIVSVVAGQFLAMYVAAVKGNALDAPRGLSKVTQTR